jgi:hypothetical protein
MRLWRMAAGRRVCGQACVSAVPRCLGRLGPRPIRRRSRQVAHFAGLRTEAGCSIGMALGLQPFASGERAGPNWHVYPKGARRVARWIFVGCGAAGRGILKGQAK